MENKLTKAEFNTIKSNTIESIISSMNKEAFDYCVKNFKGTQLSLSDKTCIRNFTMRRVDVIKRVFTYFDTKLCK